MKRPSQQSCSPHICVSTTDGLCEIFTDPDLGDTLCMLTPRYQGCKMAKDLYSIHETSTELAWALQEEKGLADDEARERDALYERAERLVSALLSIQDKLREAIDDVNEGVSLPLSPSPSESKMTE